MHEFDPQVRRMPDDELGGVSTSGVIFQVRCQRKPFVEQRPRHRRSADREARRSEASDCPVHRRARETIEGVSHPPKYIVVRQTLDIRDQVMRCDTVHFRNPCHRERRLFEEASQLSRCIRVLLAPLTAAPGVS